MVIRKSPNRSFTEMRPTYHNMSRRNYNVKNLIGCLLQYRVNSHGAGRRWSSVPADLFSELCKYAGGEAPYFIVLEIIIINTKFISPVIDLFTPFELTIDEHG